MNGNNIQKPTKFDMKLHRQNLEKLLVIYDNNLNKWVNVDRREGQWVGMGFDDNVDPVPVFGKTEENIRDIVDALGGHASLLNNNPGNIEPFHPLTALVESLKIRYLLQLPFDLVQNHH